MTDFSLKAKVGKLAGLPAIKRYENNPIFGAKDVSYPSTLAFNAGVTKFQGRYIMAFRNDKCRDDNMQRLESSGTGLAFSDDGISWKAAPRMMDFHYRGTTLGLCNDARLTVVDDRVFISFCNNGFHGERPGIALMIDECNCDVIYLGVPAQRNIILASDKVNGRYWRLERPHTRREPLRSDIWISFSQDLKYWGDSELLIGVEDVPYANVKIGGGAPPIKTEKGFLVIFHSVDNDPDRFTEYNTGVRWSSRYTAGAALLDLADPRRLIGITRTPIMIPEAPYETGNPEKFYRENVIFPGGAILEKDGILRIYYGAGDLCECMAEVKLDDLLAAISPYSRKAEFGNVVDLNL